MTENKVHYGLKNVHYAIKKTDGSYAEPLAIPGAVSLEAEPVGSLVRFFFDGNEYYTTRKNGGYTGTLEMAILPDAFREAIAGEKSDVYDNMIEPEFSPVVHFALGFQVEGDKSESFFWYYNCAAERVEQKAETVERTKEPEPEKLDWSCVPDASGVIRARSSNTTTEDWFSAVYQTITRILIMKKGALVTTLNAYAEPVDLLEVYLEPTQNFHGYAHAWAGGNGKNLWSHGDVTFTQQQQYTLSLPEGTTATISATVTSTDTDNTRCAVLFRYADNTTSGTTYLNRNTRNSVTITATKEVAYLVLYASNNYNNGAGDTATFTGVQVEVGTTATAYEPYANICPIEGHDSITLTRAGKNLIPYPYYQTTRTVNGVTITDNGDGTLTANGTATADGEAFVCSSRTVAGFMLPIGDYMLTGCPSSGSTSSYYIRIGRTVNGALQWYGNDAGNGFTFSVTEADAPYILVSIYIRKGATLNNLKFSPMITPTFVSSDTYEPYTAEIYKTEFDVLNEENLLKYPYYRDEQTASGITYSVDASGVVTANGTATATSNFNLKNRLDTTGNGAMTLNKGTYTLSGGVSSNIRLIVIHTVNGSGIWLAEDRGDGAVFEIPEDNYRIGVFYQIASGQIVADLRLQPVIRLAFTVYGGTLNVTTGELTVTKVKTYLNDLSWTLNSTTSNAFNGSFLTQTNANETDILCDTYEPSTSTAVGNLTAGIAVGANGRTCYIKDKRASTVAEIKAILAEENPSIVYPLATPQTYNLTPQQVQLLLGVNNLWAESGEIEVSYWSSKIGG